MDPATHVRGSTCVYFAFFVFGIAGLMPWNLFITARHYFDFKLSPNGSEYESANRTYLQKTFESAFTITGSITGLTGVVANACIATSVSNAKRMVTGVLLVIISIIPSIVFSLIDTSSCNGQIAFFVLTLLLLNIANFGSSGLIAAGSFGLAAKFPSKFLTIQLVGQAFAGIGTSLASILSQATTPNPRWNGFAYFIAALIFTAFSGVMYAIMIQTPFYKTHAIESKYEALSRENSDDDSIFVGSCIVVDSAESPLITCEESNPKLGVVMRKTGYACLNLVLIYCATLSCFPGLASLAVSNHSSETWQAYFIPVACFLLFNVGDGVGRFMGGIYLWPSRRSVWFVIASILRFGFIPFFMLCNLKPKKHAPTLIYADWIYSIVVFLVGFTNGHLITRASQSGIQRVCKSENELAGAVLAVFGVLGVVLGSVLSFIWVSIV